MLRPIQLVELSREAWPDFKGQSEIGLLPETWSMWYESS